ncbi:MAG: endolytic transglycosylase MltG [Lachnospiraceae bacterium]|nr:endolytic transglycosylase MltG [Lachnospiraceae bacterium]
MKKLRTTIGVIVDTLGSLIIYVLIAAAILFMAGQAKHYYEVGYGVFSQQGKDAKGTGKVVQFTVEEGTTATGLAEKLEEAGLVESARLFLIQERVSDYAGQYVAGTYALSSEMTTEDIMKVISGTEVSPYATTAEPAAEEPAQEAPQS